MTDWLGWTGLLVAATVTAFLAGQRSQLTLVLGAAFFIRAGSALFHFYVAPLPDGTADAVAFENTAWNWGSQGLEVAFSHFPGLSSDFYPWLMSLVYSVTGRSLLLLQSLSVVVGVLGVVAVWRLAREVWEGKAAGKAAWVMALFPTVVMYGALPMREAWFVLFLLVGLIGAVRWARKGGVKPLVLAVSGFLVASFFHGGAFVALLAFFAIIGARALRRWLLGLARSRLRITASLAIMLVLVLGAGYVGSGISISKLGTAEELVSAERWMHYFESRVHGRARYPEWTQPQGPVDFLWAVPLRAVYLLFSPFPWDVRVPSHLIGLIDGLFYLALVWLVWRGRQAIWHDPGARMVFLILAPLVLAFGVGTGNFGTGLRHRAKLIAALIVLAAPHLPRLVLWRRRSDQFPIYRCTTAALQDSG